MKECKKAELILHVVMRWCKTDWTLDDGRGNVLKYIERVNIDDQKNEDQH